VTGGAATAEPLDSTPAGVVGEEEIAAPGTAIPPAEVDEERGVNARPGEAAAVPTPAAGAPAEEEERQDAPAQGPASAGSILWLVTEIALGLAFAGLVAATILAWRARRRDTPWHEPPR
jgi:hypothetical protein